MTLINFKTSYVTVNHNQAKKIPSARWDFKTSYVTVNPRGAKDRKVAR